MEGMASKGGKANVPPEENQIAKISTADSRRICSMQVIQTIPAIVKELVENSLDAGATSIDVVMQGGGLQKIVVRDNGCGIPKDSIEFLGQAGATSKIRKYEDLASVTTYGFRGEALNSLCDMCEMVELTTKTASCDVGARYRLTRAGVAEAHGVVPRATGTDVTATGLFNNTPVRRKVFKKEAKSQVTAAKEILIMYALARPDVRFTLKSVDPNEQLQKSPGLDLKGAIRSLFRPRSILDHLEYGESVAGDVTVRGFFAKDDKALVNRPVRYYLFVNARPVTLKPIRQHARELYAKAFDRPVGATHPWLIVHVSVAPGQFDVNTDKSKTELLLSQEAQECVQKAFGNILTRILSPPAPPDDGSAAMDTGEAETPVAPTDATPAVPGRRASRDTTSKPGGERTRVRPAVNTSVPRAPSPSAGASETAQVRDKRKRVKHPAAQGDPNTGGLPDREDKPGVVASPPRQNSAAVDVFATRRLAELASLSPTSAHKWSSPPSARTIPRPEGGTAPKHTSKKRRIDPTAGACDEAGAAIETGSTPIDLAAWSRGIVPSVQSGADVLPKGLAASAPKANNKPKAAPKRSTPVELISDDEVDFIEDVPPPPPKVAWVQPLNLGKLESMLDAPLEPPMATEAGPDTPRLIGQCAVSGGADTAAEWIVSDSHGIALLNVYRLHELVTYEALCKSYAVPTESLAVEVRADVPPDLVTKAAHTLQLGPKNGRRTVVNDLSVVQNGFRLVFITTEAGDPELFVVGVPHGSHGILGYSVNDLAQVLDGACECRDAVFRPQAVRCHLQSEAVRITREFSSWGDRDRVEVMLRKLPPAARVECFHQRPILHRLSCGDFDGQKAAPKPPA